ncbi:MAG: GNAT family N-acyltransferase [Bacteriovoracia bacterium]
MQVVDIKQSEALTLPRRAEKTGVRFEQVQDPERRDQCYRLRYDVFVEEQGLTTSANSTFRILADELDESAVLLGAFDGDEAVATSRINYTDHERSPYRALYDLDEQEAALPGRVSVISKLVIATSHRHSSVFLRFCRYMYRQQLERNIAHCFVGCAPALAGLYAKLGFRPYKAAIDVEGFGPIQPMLLDVFNEAYLNEIRSPLLPILKVLKNTGSVTKGNENE